MSSDSPRTELSHEQANALFNILIHHQAYSELRGLRQPGALAASGPPWKLDGSKNQAPIFQNILNKTLVPLPGLRDVGSGFWQVKIQDLVEDLARDDLSESYEAGYIGIRKIFTTALAAAAEGPARGIYGGFAKQEPSRTDDSYDVTKPEDIVAGFKDALQASVYGDFLDQLTIDYGEKEKIEDHDKRTQAAHEFCLIIMASYMHFILVISPEGPTLFSLMKTANNLVPYTAVRQTLRIGNVAAMISGMTKIILAKLSINTVTTFLGITNPSDAGMNLLQTIISTVVNWDTGSLKARSSEIVKKSEILEDHQEGIEEYVNASPERREKCRTESIQKAEPVVVTIMRDFNKEPLSAEQIPVALEYLQIEISIKDRQKLVDVLCSRQPDLLTGACREGVAAFNTVIRDLHKAVDLSSCFGDLGNFLTDLFALPISNTKDVQPPNVEDFVRLLRKHAHSLHKFQHQVSKNGPELAGWFRDYAKAILAMFRVEGDSENTKGGAGKLTGALGEAILSLPEEQRSEVISEIDAHAAYLRDLTQASDKRMRDAIATDVAVTNPSRGFLFSRGSSRQSSPTRPPAIGPGMWLRRWQAYIDETEITAADMEGGVRHGGDLDVIDAGRSKSDGLAGLARVKANESEEAKPPTVKKTVDLLGERFKELLREANDLLP